MIDSLDMWKPLLVLAIFIVGCSQPQLGPSPDDRAAVDALNKWWKEFHFVPPPEKAGTVRPAHTVTSKNGRVYKMPAHVQTKKEADDEAADALYVKRGEALITGFGVKGNTVTAMTNLTRGSVDILDHDPLSTSDAQTLCQELGGFVWANPNRHFGFESIEVTGAGGELLSSRKGIRGACVRQF